MADNFISGHQSYFALDAAQFNFKKWAIPMEGGTRTFFAFGSEYQRTLPGGKKAQITANGAYNQGNMPMVIGVVYQAHLGWMAGIELVVPARLDKVEFSSETGAGGEPGGQCQIVLESDGEFTISFT